MRGLFCALAFFVFVQSLADQQRDTWRYQFGQVNGAAGSTPVTPTTVYTEAGGFGFETTTPLETASLAPASTEPNGRSAIAASAPFFFSVRVPEGNYRVTVTLGNPSLTRSRPSKPKPGG
jgi:hypothetical protein